MSTTLSMAENHQMPVVITDSEAAAGDPTLTYDLSSWLAPATLTLSTTPPITKVAKGTLTMGGGSGSIDLTATPSSGVNVSFSGLKIQRIFVKSPTTNANVVTIAKGASNGYALDVGATTWSVSLDPGAFAIIGVSDTAPDVAGGAKVFDVTGTGSQTLQYMIIGG